MWRVTLAVVMVLSVLSKSARLASVVYWCPDRPADQLYSAAPEPGCVPLVESLEPHALMPHPPVKAETLLSGVSQFLARYRWFLDCCATDVGSIEAAKNLEKDATDWLRVIPTDLFTYLMKVRGVTLTVIITPVAQARDDLYQIAQRLQQLRAAEERLATLDFFAAWSERRRLRDELESFVQGVQRPRLPAGPPTDMEIGVTPLYGPEIGVVPPTGPEIGVIPSTDKEIGQTPPTGLEIGTTGRTGPAIGDADQKR